MHLKEVILSNFRCFKELCLPLHPRLTVLVAENGGGKTSILDGIAIGLAPVLRYLSTADQRLSGPGIEDTDFRIESWKGSGGKERQGASDFSQALLETTSGLRWAHWRGSSKGKQPRSKIGQSDLSSYTSDVIDSLKSPHPKLMPVFAYYGARRGWINIPERIRESKIDYTQPSSALHGALTSLSDFREMLKWFDREEAAELRANKHGSGEDWMESPLLNEVREALNVILGGAYKYPRFDKNHKFVVEQTDGGEILQVSQLSQGYQSMLALGMDFARRLALANLHLIADEENFIWAGLREYWERWKPGEGEDFPGYGPRLAPAIMLVDEIDLHLHPSWQQRVLGDLMRAFPGTQFIVTTHSPQVLSTVRKENIRIIEELADGTWKTREPDRNPYAHTNSLSLEAVMGGDAYPPLLLTELLREYQRLVGDEKHDSPRALELRATLENEWSKTDSELQLMDVAIRKNETLRKLRHKKA
jgi:predicted ATP-binding protein involved in virulence